MTRQDRQGDADGHEFAEERESLWRITLAPATWAIHFAASYGAAATVCAKAPGYMTMLRLGVGGATVISLGLILWFGWRAWKQWDVRQTGDRLNAAGNAEDRHQFLGHAAVLLAIISGIGVIYSTLPVLILENCQ